MRRSTEVAERLMDGIRSREQIEPAKASMKRLVHIVPDGITKDRLIYSRACLARGDFATAQDQLRQWRETMTALGVFRTASA